MCLMINPATFNLTADTLGGINWSPEELEVLRLCRNRAYYKVNNKRRQHLQASLSTYLQIEWHKLNRDSKLTGKVLLQAYAQHFEAEAEGRENAATTFKGGGTRGCRRGGIRSRRNRYMLYTTSNVALYVLYINTGLHLQ